MWEGGAEFLKKRGIKPFMYELFNEPDYDDLSEYNRKLFAKKMKSKYGGKISRLNAEWGASYSGFDEISGFKNYDENAGLFVEWVKFMEDSFAGLCKFGAKVIRDADGRPDAGVCFQPIFLDGNNVNIYKADRHLDAVCSSTGGGDFFQARFMRAISRFSTARPTWGAPANPSATGFSNSICAATTPPTSSNGAGGPTTPPGSLKTAVLGSRKNSRTWC